jgi:hypothetical protein
MLDQRVGTPFELDPPREAGGPAVESQGIQSFLPVVTKISNRVIVARAEFVAVGDAAPAGPLVERSGASVADAGRNFVGCKELNSIPDQEIENINLLLASRMSYQERPYLHVGQRVR